MNDSILINDYKTISTDTFKELSGADFVYEMGQMLKLGLIRDASFYEWAILNFDSILDMNEDAIKEIISKINFIMQYFEVKDPEYKKEGKMLQFGDVFANALADYFKDKYKKGEYLSLGIIASAYISYKREKLSKEEFYELRDMFVPYNLLISLDPYDYNAVADIVTESMDCINDKYELVLLKKIGKAVIAYDVTKEEIVDALSNLIVEWD